MKRRKSQKRNLPLERQRWKHVYMVGCYFEYNDIREYYCRKLITGRREWEENGKTIPQTKHTKIGDLALRKA